MLVGNDACHIRFKAKHPWFHEITLMWILVGLCVYMCVHMYVHMYVCLFVYASTP